MTVHGLRGRPSISSAYFLCQQGKDFDVWWLLVYRRIPGVRFFLSEAFLGVLFLLHLKSSKQGGLALPMYGCA